MPDHLPTDGGFGNAAGMQNRTPHQMNNTQLTNQGQSVRNSFNGNQFNHNTNVANTNVNNFNHYGGYGGYGGYGHYGYGGYGHGYANGWAHGYQNGYWGGAGCWGYPGWSEGMMWTCMGMSSLTTFLGLGMMSAAMSSGSKNNSSTTVVTQPPSTTNITYEGDNVYINGQPAGTAAQYYQQSQQLAAQAYAQPAGQGYPPTAPNYATTSAAAPTEQYAPLGVFALAEPGTTQSNTMLQLAISQSGIVRGNYLNQLTNERSQVYGSLDKKTQRISWTIGQNNATVFDTSLTDLTKDDSEVLVHYGPNNTQEMALIRLPAPADSGGQNASTQGAPAPAGS
jgi:hypothetical protein